MKKKLIVVAATVVIAVSLAAGTLLASLGSSTTNLFTYPLSVGDKNYVITVETNWNAETAPTVSLLNYSYGIEPYFR